MEFTHNPNLPTELTLIHGCGSEAERASIVAGGLELLRAALAEKFRGYITSVAEEIRTTSRLLRELASRAQVHRTRVPIVLDHLNVLLPCLQRTLRDITAYYEDKTLSREIRWRTMYSKMTEEAAGLPLSQRFVLYNHFLALLEQLLTRYVWKVQAVPARRNSAYSPV